MLNLEFIKNILDNWETFEKNAVTANAIKEKNFVKDTFSGTFPKYLNIQRPKASPQTKKHRKDFFENVGNPAMGFIERFKATYNTIFNSEDFGVFYGHDEKNKYNLEKYLKEEYKEGDFVKNFTDNILFQLITEANGVLFVTTETPSQGLPTPLLNFEPAENVLFYSNELAFIRSSKKIQLPQDFKGQPTGNIFYLFTNFYYVILKQKSKGGVNKLSDYEVISKGNTQDERGNLTSIEPLEHNCPYMPCFLIGKDVIYRDNQFGQYYKNSLISSAVPSLRSAQFDWLDTASHKAFNSGGFMWAYGNQKCKKCNGTGTERTEHGVAACGSCAGSKTSFSVHSGEIGDVVMFPIENDSMLVGDEGKSKAPTPANMFGNYDGRPEMAEHYWQGFKDHMADAYFAASMEVVGKVSDNGSGLKKALDREEMTKFTVAVAQLACDYLQRTLTCIAHQRLAVAVAKEDLVQYIPFVRVPESFDSYTKQELTERTHELNKGGFSEEILIDNRLKIAEKQFGKSSLQYKREEFIVNIDPMAGISADKRQEMLATLTWEQTVLSLQVHRIVKECEREASENSLTCDIEKSKLICRPIVNAFWLLTESERIERVMSKAQVIATATKENRRMVFENTYGNYRNNNNLNGGAEVLQLD